IAYTTWHTDPNSKDLWGTPLLGGYVSDDRRVIRQHAEWLADAGVDFIWIDWSNDIKYTYNPAVKNKTFDMIEGATTAIFEEYAQMRSEGKKTPNISIFAGVTGAPEAATDGRLKRKADQLYKEYAENPKFRPLLQMYLGKPLLVVYVNTPSPFPNGVPQWHDDRFTVRWMTGYVTEQRNLRTDDLVSKYGYWSWEDRGAQTYTVYDGHPEAMVVVASYREQTGRGPDGKGPGYIPAAPRNHGETFRRQWVRADKIGPKFAMVVSWNEWHRGEQPSAEVSKDIEPSKEFGRFYLDLLKEQIAIFKAGK
ncbi:MAG: hypothetical protein M3Y13_10110, partial [Armatimonadota bacterium]|nr:hypothetical protein [Armatimonadota bacterium]